MLLNVVKDKSDLSMGAEAKSWKDINLSLDQINNIIKNKQAIYDLKVDKTVNKIGNGSKLINYDFKKLPIYLRENKENYKEWLD